MRISVSQLRRIIREEVERTLAEEDGQLDEVDLRKYIRGAVAGLGLAAAAGSPAHAEVRPEPGARPTSAYSAAGVTRERAKLDALKTSKDEVDRNAFVALDKFWNLKPDEVAHVVYEKVMKKMGKEPWGPGGGTFSIKSRKINVEYSVLHNMFEMEKSESKDKGQAFVDLLNKSISEVQPASRGR